MPLIYRRLGGEILVNTETANNQASPSNAVLAGGGFVVVWQDASNLGTDTSVSAIKGQRFDASGNKLGGEFLINTTVTGSQGQPIVAALPSGRFIVTWADLSASGGDTSGAACRAQLFEANGTPVGGEILVNTNTTGNQQAPMVTELAGGGFVISWSDASGVGGDTSGSGIKMQLFDANAAKVGGETLVNTVTTGNQQSPTVTALASGGFVVAWQGTAGSSGGVTTGSVRYQLFDGAGAPVGTEQVASTTGTGSFSVPNVTPLGTGFLVTWQHTASPTDGLGAEIIGQRFDASGGKLGGEFTVNTTSAGNQQSPQGHELPGGGFIITWAGESDTGFNVYGQVYDAAGARVGIEFVLSTNNGGNQLLPRIDVTASGDIVVTWIDNSGIGGDTSGSAVKVEILTLNTDAPTDIALSNDTVSETHIGHTDVATLSATGALNTSFTYTIVSDSSGGAFGIDGDKLIVADNRLLDYESQNSVDVTIRATDLNGQYYEETLQLTVTDTALELRYDAGDELIVPVDNAGLQGESNITALADGRFLVVWEIGSVLRGRIFDADGQPAGGDLLMSDFVFGANHPVVVLPGGGFVLTWMGKDTGGNFSLVGQVFDAAGAPVGAKFAIDPGTGSDQLSAVLIDAGHFVVTYASSIPDDPNSPGPFQQVRAQIFDLTGAKVGADFQVNTTVADAQFEPQVDALPGGGFVIAWTNGFGASEGSRAQIFDAAGAKVGAEIEILPGTPGFGGLHLTSLDPGGFVATWSQLVDEGGPTEHIEFYGQIFDGDGVKVGSAFLVDAVLSNYGAEVRVEALPNGNFIVVWNGISLIGDGDGDAVMAQIYTAGGDLVGDPFVVNEVTREDQVDANVAVDADGNLMFSWSDIFHPPGDVDAVIKARIFHSLNGAPVAQPDAVTTDEASVLNGSVFADNGSGPDSPGGSALTVSAVNGSAVAVGVQITLDSGAHLMVNANGTFSYDPNHAFDDLPAAGSGASNLTETESFTYTLAGGGTAMVTVTVHGLDSNDVLLGTAGADTLIGGAGVDTMSAGAGDDNYYVDNPDDVVIELPGEGRDVVYTSASWALGAGSSVDVISTNDPGGTTAIALAGNELRQEIFGNAGDNLFFGRGGADYIVGGAGNDTYYIASGQETLVENVGEGRDVVYTAISFNLTPGQSLDVLSAMDISATTAINLGGNALRQEIFGNNGDNILIGLGGDDLLVGYGGDDIYYISSGTETIVEGAGGGRDVIYTGMTYALAAGAQIEAISTTSIVDTTPLNLAGNEFAQEIYGNNGNNILLGRGGADLLAGYGGDDTYYVVDGGERIVENVGGGSDTVYSSVSYNLTAGSAVEALSAVDPGATTALALGGNEFAQAIYGNAGANILNGLGGSDYLFGGGGADSFRFTTTLGAGNVDRIADFQSGTDKIALDDAVFTALGAPGALNANAFFAGTAAHDADDRIIYDAATGNLYYDADGNGGGAQILFATLDTHPVIAAGDFSVI